ncbi:MAG: DMT family transporter [Oscillospiraceae bacterium]|nr:DMT family transporter [Oscillospiraceae bacterium]
MDHWVILVLIFGLCVGFGNIFRKKAVKSNTPLQVLCGYTLVSFLLVTYEFSNAMQVDMHALLLILLKSLLVTSGWILSFICIKHLPISIYGVLLLSRMLFSMLWGVLFLGEALGTGQILGRNYNYCRIIFDKQKEE